MECAIFVHFLDICDVTQFPCPSMSLPFANQFSFNRNLTKMTVFISQILSLHSEAYIIAQASDQSLINFDYNIQIQSSNPSITSVTSEKNQFFAAIEILWEYLFTKKKKKKNRYAPFSDEIQRIFLSAWLIFSSFPILYVHCSCLTLFIKRHVCI